MTQPSPDQASPAAAAIWRNSAKDGPPLFSVRAESTATPDDVDTAVERALAGWRKLEETLNP